MFKKGLAVIVAATTVLGGNAYITDAVVMRMEELNSANVIAGQPAIEGANFNPEARMESGRVTKCSSPAECTALPLNCAEGFIPMEIGLGGHVEKKCIDKKVFDDVVNSRDFK